MRLTMMVVGLGIAGVIGAGSAQAAPMCRPANGPLGNLWPQVQSCQVPGIYGRFIRSAPPQTVPYPVNIPTPGWPFQVPRRAPLG